VKQGIQDPFPKPGQKVTTITQTRLKPVGSAKPAAATRPTVAPATARPTPVAAASAKPRKGGQTFMAWTVIAGIALFGYLWQTGALPSSVAPAAATAAPAKPAQPAQPAVQKPEPATPTPVPPKRPSGPEAFWVKNHQITDMWSGPASQPGVMSFGKTDAQFCAFLVAGPSEHSRLFAYNPVSQNYFWIEQDAVGRVEPPQVVRTPRPHDRNCADADFPD
jgi:hypothetical protein